MKNVAEAFNQYIEDYDKWFDSPAGRVLFEMEVEAVRLLMRDLKHPFLEIGVGTGRFAKELGIEFGIDPSQKTLEIAEKRGIKVKRAKGEKLPFEDESFGGVFILFTLCFVKNPGRVFAEANRVLKKGGGLIVGMINRESLWGELYMKKKAEGHPIYKYAKLYSINEVGRMIETAGFNIEDYSSTLCQMLPGKPLKENAHKGFVDGAGFVCILARRL
jgi:ubiquinone/menaquinone biosynthesis C-methylase UbiE